MGYLREGDHLVVVAVDRLGRSVREVATALHELTSRGVHVRSLREGVDTSTPTGRAVTSIMATIARGHVIRWWPRHAGAARRDPDLSWDS
jgi:DNA invertase Pin-like site-specific DNA recombinase